MNNTRKESVVDIQLKKKREKMREHTRAKKEKHKTKCRSEHTYKRSKHECMIICVRERE
jgi:hypothetical protein